MRPRHRNRKQAFGQAAGEGSSSGPGPRRFTLRDRRPRRIDRGAASSRAPWERPDYRVDVTFERESIPIIVEPLKLPEPVREPLREQPPREPERAPEVPRTPDEEPAPA